MFGEALRSSHSSPPTVLIDSLLRGHGFENFFQLGLILQALPLLLDALKAILDILCKVEQVVAHLALNLVLLLERIFVQVRQSELFGPLRDPRLNYEKMGKFSLYHLLSFSLLLVPTVVWLEQGLNFVFSRLDHLLDQLALHVKELDAEPDVLDVLLAGDHKIEAIELLRLMVLTVNLRGGFLHRIALVEEFFS